MICLKTIERLLKIKKHDVDVVIKTRPDIILTKPLKTILSQIPLEDNTLYFQSSMGGGHLYAGEFPNNPCDWFFLEKRKMKREWCEKHQLYPQL